MRPHSGSNVLMECEAKMLYIVECVLTPSLAISQVSNPRRPVDLNCSEHRNCFDLRNNKIMTSVMDELLTINVDNLIILSSLHGNLKL